MENKRETKQIEVSGHTIEMYTFVNTLEHRKLTEILTNGARIGADGNATDTTFSITSLYEAQDYIINAIVVSFDGIKSGINEAILSLPKAEGEAVLQEINSALNLDLGSKKK
jgi:hypothetical protein